MKLISFVTSSFDYFKLAGKLMKRFFLPSFVTFIRWKFLSYSEKLFVLANCKNFNKTSVIVSNNFLFLSIQKATRLVWQTWWIIHGSLFVPNKVGSCNCEPRTFLILSNKFCLRRSEIAEAINIPIGEIQFYQPSPENGRKKTIKL